MGVTCGAETAYPSAASEFTLGFYYSSCCSIFSFYVVFVDHRVSFFVIVLSVFRFTASDFLFDIFKKSLKMPKGQSESVYLRRTDNTMAKKKNYKRTNSDLQNIHIILKIE